MAAVSETEDEHKGFVDGTKLVCIEPAGRPTEPLRIDEGGLLDEDARLMTLERPPGGSSPPGLSLR